MPQFTRPTIVAAGRIIDNWRQASIDSFLLDFGLEHVAPKLGNSTETRANLLIRHLLDNPNSTTDDGENLVDAVVRDVVERVANTPLMEFAEAFPKLARGLARDGFVVKDGHLRKALPMALGLPEADDEVHELLKLFGFGVPMGHLDQAIQNHTNGRWAAANGQIRSFLEGLVNEIAEKLAKGAELPPPGGARLNWLAKLNPPFVLSGLNEWDGHGKGLFEALYRRLQPEGPHPGLSDDEDSTFRLHTVLVVARLLLRRLAQRLAG